MDEKHAIEVKDPRARVPPVLAAHCTCGWAGPARTGRNAAALVRQDGNQHLERAGQGEGSKGSSATQGARRRVLLESIPRRHLSHPSTGYTCDPAVSPPWPPGTISAEEGTPALPAVAGRAAALLAPSDSQSSPREQGRWRTIAEKKSIDSERDARPARAFYAGHSRFARRALDEARLLDAQSGIGEELPVIRIKALIEAIVPDAHEAEVIARARRAHAGARATLRRGMSNSLQRGILVSLDTSDTKA
jgi:hypothetical protein